MQNSTLTATFAYVDIKYIWDSQYIANQMKNQSQKQLINIINDQKNAFQTEIINTLDTHKNYFTIRITLKRNDQLFDCKVLIIKPQGLTNVEIAEMSPGVKLTWEFGNYL